MSHDYHDALPGYDEYQLLVDGCGECEHRAKAGVDIVVANMDPERFAMAWHRALLFGAGRPLKVSEAEAPTLRVLSAVRNHMESAQGHGDLARFL